MPSYTSWLLRAIGFDPDRLPPDAEVQWAWTNAPQSWKIFVMLGCVGIVCYGVVRLYRQEIGVCPTWCKRLLIGIRLTALLLLFFVFLGPAVAPVQPQVTYPNIVVLRDSSLSMNTSDRYLDRDTAQSVAGAIDKTVDSLRVERPTRVGVMEAALDGNRKSFLKRIEQLGKVQVIDFSNQVTIVETRPVRQVPFRKAIENNEAAEIVHSMPRLAATGMGTDIHQAIAHVLVDDRTSAAIVFTDGQHTAKEHSHDELLAIAKQAGDKGLPLYFVGLGDPSVPRNLKITEVYADPQVWRDDPFEIQANLQADGIDSHSENNPSAAPQNAIVTLTERRILDDGRPAETEVVLEQRSVVLTRDGIQRLVFSHTARSEGRFAYDVRVDPIENEISEEDNKADHPAEVKVLGEQARVLLVAGAPTWDYRGLQQLLSREKSIHFSCWLQTMDVTRRQEGHTAIDRLPITREELFAYDVIILADPNPIEFDAAWLGLLKQFISEHAGGFLYMAGPKFSGRFLSADKTRDMRDVLPVRFGDVRAMEVEALLSNNMRAWDLGVVGSNIDQPIMRFYPESDRTLDRWKKMPGIYWSFPSQQAKPSSRVLIEHTDPTLRDLSGSRPLLVTGQYGSGRTVYVGFNGSWRWRQVGNNAEYYKRFWIQMIRYLVEGRTLEGKRRGSIETESIRYQLGDSVKILARLKDPAFKPLQLDNVPATLRVAGQDPVSISMNAVPDQPGHFEATWIARSTGQHIARVALDGAVDSQHIEVAFHVSMPMVESNAVWLDKPLLTEMGRISGGGYFELNQLDKLAESIPDARRTIHIRGTPVPLWDTQRMLVLLVGMLSVEWAVRKRFKLM